MPELPEIETIRNGLRRFVLNQTISSLDLRDKKLPVKASDLNKIKGDRFSDVLRLGKLLIFTFQKSDKKLLIHLKMTGQLVFLGEKTLIAGGHSEKNSKNLQAENLRHIRFQIVFSNNYKLVLNDTRRFAYVRLVGENDFLEVKKRFGLEPLSDKEFNYSSFLKLIEKRPRKNIKAFLLDQSLIAGIGNIYADETLFSSKVSPQRSVASLNNIEKKKIFENIRRILKLAVSKRGTTFSDYVDAEGKSGGFLKLLKVYGKNGQKCPNCPGKIVKIKVAGRGTHYCPKCQR